MLSLGATIVGVTLYLVQADADNRELATVNATRIGHLEETRDEDKARNSADLQEIKEDLGAIDAKLDALLLQLSDRNSRRPDQ